MKTRLLALSVAALSLAITAGTMRAQTLSWSSPAEDIYDTSRGGQDDGVGAAIWAAESSQLYIAWFDASNNLYVKSQSPTSPTFPLNTAVTDSYTGASDSKKPSVAVTYDGQNLLIGFVQNGALKVAVVNYLNPSHYSTILSPCSDQVVTFAPSIIATTQGNYMYFARSSDHALGSCTFDLLGSSSSTINSSIDLGSAPSAVIFGGSYYVYFKQNDSSNHLDQAYGSSPDSTSLVYATYPSGSHTSTAPSATIYNGIVYIGFRQNDPNSHAFFYTYTTDGVSYHSPILVNWSMGGPPQLVTYLSGPVFNIFRQNDYSSYLFEATAY